jgi:hypothetical protein
MPATRMAMRAACLRAPGGACHGAVAAPFGREGLAAGNPPAGPRDELDRGAKIYRSTIIVSKFSRGRSPHEGGLRGVVLNLVLNLVCVHCSNNSSTKYTVLKVIRIKLTSEVYANSAGVRCAIYSRDTAICICRIPQFKNNKPCVKIPSWDKVKGLAEYFCRPNHF